MRKTLNFNGKSVNLECNAATPLVGKRIFNIDFLQFFQKSNDIEDAERIDKFERVAFTMAMQAEEGTKGAMAKTEDDFIDWLAEFDFQEIMQNVLKEAASLWTDTQSPASVPKKESGQQ